MAAGQHLVVAISDEGQRDRVADRGRSRGNYDFGPGAEGDGAIGAGQDRAAALLESDMDSVERNRFGPESVGQADAGLLAPNVGSDDQAEGLVRGAFRGVRESEAKLGLGGGVADGIRALSGGGPGDDKVRRGRRARGGEGQGRGEDQAGQDAAGDGEHGRRFPLGQLGCRFWDGGIGATWGQGAGFAAKQNLAVDGHCARGGRRPWI